MTVRVSELNFSQIVTTLILWTRCVQICKGIEAEIKLDVEGSGFHRTLIYHAYFKDLINNNCQAAIYIELPSALYVNVDEIAELRRKGTSTICSIGETDVELFAEKAGRQNVTTCAPVSSSLSTLMIPLHQRYRYARETGGYVDVIVPEPKLLLGCRERVRDHRVSKLDLCEPCVNLAIKWREIPYRMSNDRTYVWPIPVGNSSISTFVTYGTLLATIIGAIFIANAIRTNISKNHSKQD
ncbi:phosphatidylinositol-glycan biosynthesis class X protein [Anoplolepis gracilipes]|uniref:phosphatidylinositol-glycan biosynthesis class X protein n=1 Tax=Anoplolepis gracilipes TaxID=354296 RepID=UPI003BA115A5